MYYYMYYYRLQTMRLLAARDGCPAVVLAHLLLPDWYFGVSISKYGYGLPYLR